jgi:N-methylhydantoinase B/oxoprolinase/acetone carboxylase alpha subunit
VAIRDGAETELPDKVALELRKQDVISVQTPGGGAYGQRLSK